MSVDFSANSASGLGYIISVISWPQTFQPSIESIFYCLLLFEALVKRKMSPKSTPVDIVHRAGNLCRLFSKLC